MNRSEQTKVKVLNEVAQGALTAKEATNLLGLSLRHTRRLLAAYRREGRLPSPVATEDVDQLTLTTRSRARDRLVQKERRERIAVLNDDTTFLGMMRSLVEEEGWDSVISRKQRKMPTPERSLSIRRAVQDRNCYRNALTLYAVCDEGE